MRPVLLSLLAVAALAAGALAAQRVAEPPKTTPGLSIDAGRPLFALSGLRHGDRAERCVTVTNEGPGEARASILARSEGGDLAPLLRVAVERGCGGGAVLFSGALSELGSVPDAEPWPQGERRRYRIAVEVAGSDDAIAGRRAVQEFAFAAEGTQAAPAPEAPRAAEAPAASVVTEAPSQSAPCTRLRFARDRRLLVKRHRVDRRVSAKLILRIYGLTGEQRLVLVTGLRIGRGGVVMGRDWGSVAYRVNDGAAVTSRRRPFRVRIAPGALKPGKNTVRVTVRPKHGRPVKARYVLTIAGAESGCEIG